MYGIYANIWGILMGSMLAYIAYMDPMGYIYTVSCVLYLFGVPTAMARCTHLGDH